MHKRIVLRLYILRPSYFRYLNAVCVTFTQFCLHRLTMICMSSHVCYLSRPPCISFFNLLNRLTFEHHTILFAISCYYRPHYCSTTITSFFSGLTSAFPARQRKRTFTPSSNYSYRKSVHSDKA